MNTDGVARAVVSVRLHDSDHVDGFRRAGDGTLVLLLHERVPVSAIGGVVSLATKVHPYSNVRIFVFGDKRAQMMSVPGFRWVEFSTDPETVGKLIQENDGQQ